MLTSLLLLLFNIILYILYNFLVVSSSFYFFLLIEKLITHTFCETFHILRGRYSSSIKHKIYYRTQKERYKYIVKSKFIKTHKNINPFWYIQCELASTYIFKCLFSIFGRHSQENLIVDFDLIPSHAKPFIFSYVETN